MAERKNSRRKTDLFVGVCLMLLAQSLSSLVGCKPQHSSTKEVAQPSQPIKEEPKYLLPDSVELQDMVMTRSGAQIISGKDLRPVYIIEGRIKNNSPRDITAVSIRVSVRKGDTEVDGTDLRIESLVPGGAVRSFRRQIQVMPPKSGMNWAYEVTAVQ